MGSNVDKFGAFDDIVLVFKTSDGSKFCLFLQLKKKSKGKITYNSLISEKHDFSLKKYYESYIKIEEMFDSSDDLFSIDVKFEDCIFLLYTSADVDCKSLTINDVQPGPEKIAMTGGSVLRLNEDDHKQLYEDLVRLPKLKEFLNRFVIMYSQASANELNELISNEIYKYIKLSEDEKDSAFHKFHGLIQDWWDQSYSSVYLNDSDIERNPLRKTLDHIRDMRITSLMKERRSELDKLNLKFCDTVLTDLNEVVKKKKATLIITPQHSMKITSAKLHQLLDNSIDYTDYGILRLEDFSEQITDIWSNGKFNAFVMQLEKSSQQFTTVFSNLTGLPKKIIFVANKDNTNDVQLLKKHLLNDLEIYYDSSKYDILSPETRTVLLRKKVLFQGHELELKEIGIRTLDWLDEPCLSLLLQEDKLEIGAKPPDPVDCYIQRTLKFHINLSSNARKLKRVHSVTWKPESVLDGDDRVVIITSEPGMGKSTLLTHLFRTTKQFHPHKWVVRININDFTKMLDEFKKNGVKKEDALTLLENAAAENSSRAITELEKNMLKYSYEVTGNLIVLVDGMDEISPDYCREAFRILEELYHHGNVEKIWVTTRPHLQIQLERLLNVQSLSLIPFNEEEQKFFLTKYWKSKISNLEEKTLNFFLKHVLEVSNKCLSEKDLDFMGIPLQILLLAEMYLENLQPSSPTQGPIPLQDVNITMLYEKYIDKKWKICTEEKLKTDLTKVQAMRHNGILKKEFIMNNMYASMLTVFSNAELNSIEDDSVMDVGETYLKLIEEEGDMTGLIVRAFGGKAQYVHRTMAEYFAAKWIFEHPKEAKCILKRYIFKSKNKVIKRLLDHFLLKDSPLHMSVLNRNVAENIEQFQQESVNGRDRLGRTALHIAVMYELPNETKILLKHDADINIKDKLMEWTPVEYAKKMCELSAEDLDGSLLGQISTNNKLVNAEIMEARPETVKVWASKKRPDMCDESYLYLAAKHGLVNLLTHFVSNRDDINAKVHGGHRLLLHQLSYFGQVETMKVILEMRAKCDIVDGYGNTALHISVVRNHMNVAATLLDSGANVNSRNINGCTALHLAVILYKYDFVEFLVSKGADINSKDDNDYTPLTISMSSGDVKMVQLLQSNFIRVLESEE